MHTHPASVALRIDAGPQCLQALNTRKTSRRTKQPKLHRGRLYTTAAASTPQAPLASDCVEGASSRSDVSQSQGTNANSSNNSNSTASYEVQPNSSGWPMAKQNGDNDTFKASQDGSAAADVHGQQTNGSEMDNASSSERVQYPGVRTYPIARVQGPRSSRTPTGRRTKEQGRTVPPALQRKLADDPTPLQVIQYFSDLDDSFKSDMQQARGARESLTTRRTEILEAIVLDALHKFSLEDLLELFQLCAELEHSVDSSLFPGVLSALEDEVVKQVDNMGDEVETWTQVLWLYRLSVSLQHSRKPLLQHTINKVNELLEQESVDGVCSLVLAATYIGLHKTHSKFVDRLLSHAVTTVPTNFSYHWQLCNMIWCLARMDHHRAAADIPVYLAALSGNAAVVRPKFAANVVWACAMLRLPCKDYCDELAELFSKEGNGFPAKQLANVVWGWARLGYRPPEGVMDAVEQQALKRAKYFYPQDWDSLLWGIAKIERRLSPELVDACMQCLVRCRAYLKGRSLCSIIRSYAECHSTVDDHFEELVSMAEYRAHTLTPFDISNLLMGLGHMRYPGVPIMTSSPPEDATYRTAALCNDADAAQNAASNGSQPTTASEDLDTAEWQALLGLQGPSSPGPSVRTDMASTIATQQSISQSAAPSSLAGANDSVNEGDLIGDVSGYVNGDVGGVATTAQQTADTVSAARVVEDGRQVETRLLQRLEARTLLVLDGTTHQGLANIFWGFAKLNYSTPRLQAALIQNVIQRADELNCRDLLDVLWSLARMPAETDVKLVELLTERLSKYFSSAFVWGPREYSSLLWSLGSLNCCSSSLIMALRPQHAQLLPHCKPMDLTNALWGMARLGISPPAEAAAAASNRLLSLLDNMTPEELGTCLVSLARLEHRPSAELLQRAADTARQQFAQYDAKAIAYIVSALAKFAFEDDALHAAVLRRLVERPETFDILDWENLLSARVRLVTKPIAMLEQVDLLLERLSAQGEALPPGVIAPCAWLAAMHSMFEDPPRYSSYLKQLPIPSAVRYDPSALRMLHQAHQLACVRGAAESNDMPYEVRLLIASESARGRQDPLPTRYQSDVVAALNRLDVAHRSNVPAKNNLFRVDVVLDRDREQVCILLLHNNDVLHGTQQLLGNSLYRQKMLQAYGWRVLTLGQWEWESVAPLDSTTSDSKELKEAFMMAWLSERGVSPEL